MSQEFEEMGWNPNKNYRAMGGQKEDDFNEIKINLGNKAASYEEKKTQPSDMEENKLEGRKSSASAGGNSGLDRSGEVLSPEESRRRANRCCNALHVDYYRSLFNVTTQEVLQRITFSLIPTSDKLLQAIGDSPDFYGPFWMYTTLIFLLAFAENLHNFINVGSDKFEYDFKNFPPSITFVYGIGFGAPLALSLLAKYLSETEMKFKEITCIYGYSFTSI